MMVMTHRLNILSLCLLLELLSSHHHACSHRITTKGEHINTEEGIITNKSAHFQLTLQGSSPSVCVKYNQQVPRPSMPVSEGQKPNTTAPVEQLEQVSISSMPLTEGQKSNEAAPAEGEKPSKSALKKAAKEKEKAEKAAKREQQEREEKEKAAASDTASHLYGHLNYEKPPPYAENFLDLGDLKDVEENSRVTFEARVGNARVQSAKLGFLVLRDGFDSIQVVVAEGGGHSISRLMVKWCGGLNTESIVRVTGLVQAPKEEVKSTTISHRELHLESIYIVAEAPEQLPIQVKDCNQPPPGEEEGEAENEGLPNVGLKARLDNKVLSLRSPAGEAIIQIQSEVTRLFNDYMFQHKFTDIQPSYLAGAATEGGAGVFEVKYFDEKAFLTQSPQFFKQMAIAGGMKRVFLVGPVFRAENSNTKRHLTEVCCSAQRFSCLQILQSNRCRSSLVSTSK